MKTIYKKVTYPGVPKDKFLISDRGVLIDALTGREYKTFMGNDGYLRYYIEYRQFLAHRLVAWEFCPNDDPEHKTQVDHLYGNKTDNWYKHLEWVTPRENTIRAQNLGFRKIRGEDNGHSVYKASQIEDFCKRMSKGEHIMSIIRSETGNPNARAIDSRGLYVLLYKLRTHKIWPDISNKYEFPKMYRAEIPPKPGIGTNIYGEDIIRGICDLLENGKTPTETSCIISEKLYGPDFSKKQFATIRDVAWRIQAGASWRNISKEYPNIWNKILSRSSPIDEDQVCKLYDEGYNQNEICDIINVGKCNRDVRNILRNYRIMKNTPTNEIIVDEEEADISE